MKESYLDVLEQSLVEKLKVLDRIQEYNVRQEALFKSENPEMSQFDAYVSEKGQLIEQLTRLDEGFEILYASLAEELSVNRHKYTEQIKRLQALVAQVVEKGVAVEAQEQRNKKLVEEYFKRERTGIRKGRLSSKAAYDYYKTMNKSNVVAPQFMDSKK